jgi:hypothetical protein
MNIPHACRDGGKWGANPPQKRKRPDSVRVIGRPFEQPSPEVCSQLLYVPIAAGGMARTGDWYSTIW